MQCSLALRVCADWIVHNECFFFHFVFVSRLHFSRARCRLTGKQLGKHYTRNIANEEEK